MKLSRVRIKNFRSIEEIEIGFDPKCRVLVGINESGKSNILKALALLNDNLDPVTEDDKREALPDERSIPESYVRFIFKLDKNDSDHLIEVVGSQICAKLKTPAMASKDGKNLKLREICAIYDEALYTVNIITRKKYSRTGRSMTCFNSSKDGRSRVNPVPKISLSRKREIIS